MNVQTMIMQFGWKFLLGGGLVVLATYLSNINRPMLAGIAVLFPGITLGSYFVIGYTQGVDQIRASLPASTFAAIGFAVLLGVMYIATYHFDVYGVIALSFLAWVFVTTGLILLFS